jgi:enterochelin esterase-like enzyme
VASTPLSLQKTALQNTDLQNTADKTTSVSTSTADAPQPHSSRSLNAKNNQSNSTLNYQIETYTSQVLGYSHTYGVSLPPGYDQQPDRRYPVIFLLHGGHGDPSDMFRVGKGRLLPTLEKLYATGVLPPSIIITPDGYDQHGSDPHRDPAYIDGPHGQFDTAIGDELVKLVQRRYRTLPAPKFWAIGGLSSGAWGAVNIGLHHPDHFSILLSHSGYFKDKSGTDNSPSMYVTKLSPALRQLLHVYIDVGNSDKRYMTESEQFHLLLNRLSIANVFHIFPGKHTWQFWRQHFADSLAYAGEQFRRAL